jgi:hypothetical protein
MYAHLKQTLGIGETALLLLVGVERSLGVDDNGLMLQMVKEHFGT